MPKFEDVDRPPTNRTRTTKLLVEKALDAEMTEHLGHEKHERVVNAAGNIRNGRSRKTLKGKFGELPIEIPCDREGTFEPKLVPSIRPVGPASTTRSCRCTPAA